MNSKKIKNYVFILPLIFFLFFSLNIGVGSAFSFLEKTGVDATAKGTGHTSQKIFNSAESLDLGAGAIVNIILSLVGVLFMALIIYGGVLWMTAGGNEERVNRAKSTITRAVIGLAVVLLAYSISILLVTAFSGSL